MSGNVTAIFLGGALVLGALVTSVPPSEPDPSTWDLDRYPEVDVRRYNRGVRSLRRFFKKTFLVVGTVIVLVGLIGLVLD